MGLLTPRGLGVCPWAFLDLECLPPGLGAPVFPHLTSMAGSAARSSMDGSALCVWNRPFPDAVHGGVQEARVVIACSDPRQTHASPAQIPGWGAPVSHAAAMCSQAP